MPAHADPRRRHLQTLHPNSHLFVHRNHNQHTSLPNLSIPTVLNELWT